MNEDKKDNIMETNVPPLPPPLTWRDGAIPVLAVALAWIFWACFDLERIDDYGLPHVGILILVCAHFAAVLTVLGRRARFDAGGLFCAAAALALGVSCGLYSAGTFLVLNCFVILLAAAMATFSLAGREDCGSGRALWDTVCLSCAALFTRLGRPFQAWGRALRGDKRRAGTAALAVLIALPVVGAVLWLLSSADAVFGSFFARIDLSALPEDALLRTARVVLLALFLASALYFIREQPPAPAPEKPERERRAALFLPVTALLDIVYIIFCYVQIKYLFGGAEEASMSGGWAEYARSGFFQLVTITFINLGLTLLAADRRRFAGRGGKPLRALLGLLLALTAVILVSAFWRMRLYILAFGMSALRLLTLWAMGSVCFGLLAAAWKLARPDARFFRAAGGFALALWCLMNLAGPGRMIANYNVDHYLSGALTEVDETYLRALGPDALPALEKLDEAGALEQRHFLLQLRLDRENWTPWPQRTL